MIRSRTKVAAVLLSIIGLSLIAVGWLFFKGRAQESVTVKLPAATTRALMKLVGVHQTATKNGAVQWELDADTAELEAKSGRMILSAPKVQFFLEDGSVVDVSARKGILDTRSHDIEVQGNVEVRDGRYTLMTEMLLYKHGDRIMETKAPVKITGRQIDLRADAMTYDLDKNTALFKGRVVGNIHGDFSI